MSSHRQSEVCWGWELSCNPTLSTWGCSWVLSGPERHDGVWCTKTGTQQVIYLEILSLVHPKFIPPLCSAAGGSICSRQWPGMSWRASPRPSHITCSLFCVVLHQRADSCCFGSTVSFLSTSNPTFSILVRPCLNNFVVLFAKKL